MENKICTWDKNADCKNCDINSELNCTWKKSHLMYFIKAFLPIAFLQLVPLVAICHIHSIIWPVVAYVLFFPIGLGVFETRFICSHCPFYDKEGKILHCLANHGLFKIWKYRPEPMNKIERFCMRVLGILVVIVFSLTFYGYLIGYEIINYNQFSSLEFILSIGLFIATVATSIFVSVSIMKNICTKCVNFSCPFNKVQKTVVDSYLKKNKVMREAWEKSGYKLG